MNDNERATWRKLSERLAAEIEYDGLTYLAEGMPARSTAVMHYCPQHGGGVIVPPAHRSSEVVIDGDEEDEVVDPAVCAHLADHTFLDSFEPIIDADGPTWVRFSAVVEKDSVEGLLAMWDHMDIPHTCDAGHEFFYALLEQLLEVFIHGMGR